MGKYIKYTFVQIHISVWKCVLDHISIFIMIETNRRFYDVTAALTRVLYKKYMA